MSEYTHLVGAEQVERAGYNISSAVESMGRHVGYLGDHLERFSRRLDQFEAVMTDLVERLEDLADEKKGTA